MGRCIVSFSRCCRSHAPMSGGLRAPRSPLRQGCQTLHLLRTASPSSLGSTDGVDHYMTTVASFVVGNTIYVAFFIRFDSRRSTPGGCFPQRSLSAPNRLLDYMRAILRNLFRRPCAAFYGRAGLRFGRAPQRAARPLIPGRARPAPALTRLFCRVRANALRTAMQ